MKYYIPTSSLNFNNILSSESISPQSFYSQREFGYSRWILVEENPFNDFILLYEEPFEFNRPISDVEDHPLLIELYTEEVFPELAEGIHYSDHTIYLNPWDCRFIFFDEKHLTITLSMSESSLETKMVGLYGRRICVDHFHNLINAEQLVLPSSTNTPEKFIQDDIRLNKMKGLLYGYYIGALLSTSEDVIQKLRLLREIQNIFAAVLSSEDRRLTQSQEERLSNIFSTLNKQHPLYQDLLDIVSDETKVEEILNLLKRYGHNLIEYIV